MWSVGCILYELAVGSPLFPARDENELLEYFIITIGELPHYMIRQAKKYKQFFKHHGDGVDELIRSKKSTLGHGPLKPGCQDLHQLMEGKAEP